MVFGIELRIGRDQLDFSRGERFRPVDFVVLVSAERDRIVAGQLDDQVLNIRFQVAGVVRVRAEDDPFALGPFRQDPRG